MYNWCCPNYCQGWGNEGSNSWWLWIVLIIFIVFFLCGSDDRRHCDRS